MCTFYMPVSKVDEFFVGKMNAVDYAKTFDKDLRFLDRIGIDTAAFSIRMIGGVEFSNVWRGALRALGLNATSKGSEEL